MVRGTGIEPVAPKLLDNATGAVKDLMEAAALTGARAGELTSLTRGQFDARLKTIALSGKTGARTIPLSPAAETLFTRLAKGKLPAAPLLTRDDRKPWAHSDWDELVRAAAERAKLPKKGLSLHIAAQLHHTGDNRRHDDSRRRAFVRHVGNYDREALWASRCRLRARAAGGGDNAVSRPSAATDSERWPATVCEWIDREVARRGVFDLDATIKLAEAGSIRHAWNIATMYREAHHPLSRRDPRFAEFLERIQPFMEAARERYSDGPPGRGSIGKALLLETKKRGRRTRAQGGRSITDDAVADAVMIADDAQKKRGSEKYAIAVAVEKPGIKDRAIREARKRAEDDLPVEDAARAEDQLPADDHLPMEGDPPTYSNTQN